MFVMPHGIVGTLRRTLRALRRRKSRGRETGAWPNRDVALAEILRSPATSTEQVALATEGLTLRFGGLTAVDDVSLEVRSGTVHALIGPNGAGKSSLLNLISGLLHADDGQHLVLRHDIAGRPSHELARLGIARTFQNTELFGQMTVLENVLAGLQPALSQHARRDAAAAAALRARGARVSSPRRASC